MKEVYPTFIVEDGKDYLVYIPDYDIYTQGTSIANAIEMARDAIGLNGIEREDEGIELPKPSTYEKAQEKIQNDTELIDFTKGIQTMVDIDFVEYRRKMD